jgi:hypothetical protein
MNSGFVVELLPELDRLAYCFRRALEDHAIDRDDLVQEGVVKLLELDDDLGDESDRKRRAIRIFINQCRSFERRAVRRYRKNYVEMEDELLAELPGPYSFASLLTRMAIEECLSTISEMDRSLIMEFIEPTQAVALAAVRRIYRSDGHGTSPSIIPGDIANGRGVSRVTVGRALKRARYALVTGGFRE